MNNTNNVCIYQFLDNQNIPFYVGKTNNFKRRKNEHLCILKKGKKGKTWPVYNKIRKLISEEGYELKIELIKDGMTNDEANLLEIEYIKSYKEKGVVLYNLTDGGEGTLNHKPVFTDEWKKKLSEAKSGDNFKGEKNSFYGKKHTEETKKILSEQRKGKMVGVKNPFYGKKHTNETKTILAKNASERFKDKPKSEEQKRKMSISATGKKHNKERIEQNRLLQSKKYNIVIKENGDTFSWERGCIELSKFLYEKYLIKMTPSALTDAAKQNRESRKLLITYLD